MARKKKAKKEVKEEVCEIFEIKKDGKEETKKICEEVKSEKSTKEEVKSYNKLLRNILIGLGIIVILIIVGIYFINSVKYFSYRGIEGEVVKEGNLIFYRIPIPFILNGKEVEYNIYIRNPPKELEKVPFEGEIFSYNNLAKFDDNSYRMIINVTGNFDCDGKELIAIGNLINLKAIRIKVMRDANASCDEQGRYIYLDIKESDTSGIKQTGKACYELNIAKCEILQVTEKFMVESIVKYLELTS
ncbi:MAG TPA: hypothetical protein VJ438_06575 [Candidatus Nanoarchaeia archaeon]|nr:hypothetical protein [Candidatus Nanoarchaeia archaeon]